jgi:hypothetical protein
MKRVLKPGGYLEVMEYRVGYDNPGPITQIRNDQGMLQLRSSIYMYFTHTFDYFLLLVIKYLNSKGIDPETTISSIPEMMRSELSFSDFNREDRISPIGRWGGEFGSMVIKSKQFNIKKIIRFFFLKR